MTSTPPIRLNLAAFCAKTRAHGPGLRSVVYVQGCRQHCQGCISPEWQERGWAQMVRVTDLAQTILAQGVSGVSFSGGEPFLQAEGLVVLADFLRMARPSMDILCHTGYTLGQLLLSGNEFAAQLLARVDVLIDGPYIERLNDGRGLRGSTNQVVHRLSQRGKAMQFDFEGCARKVEFQVSESETLMVGIPPHGVLKTLGNERDN
jgi:anaerobic ribonucleoside-triphosphate reductase activating protein